MVPEHSAILIVAVVLVITHLGLAVLMATVTARAAAGRLPRNQWVGIRTPATMRGEAAWIAGHRAARRLTPLYVLNSAAASAVLVLGVLRGWSVGHEILVGILAFVTFTVISVYAVIIAGRAARSTGDDQ